MDEVNKFNEIVYDIEIVSSNMDFAVNLRWSGYLDDVHFLLNTVLLRLEKKSFM